MIKNDRKYRYLVVGDTGIVDTLVLVIRAGRCDYRSALSFSSIQN
ncbi:hypothetical protein [Bartonella sp. AU18XJBT]|nr:hypothetical protein [Bartonella sp. AU18XJBT]